MTLNDNDTKILLATGLMINSASDVVILNFLQSSHDVKDKAQHVIARIAVTPKCLSEYIKLLQEGLRQIEALSDEEKTQ